MLREFDDYAEVGVLDACEHWCVALRGFNGGGHDLFALFDVHGWMLSASAADQERTVAGVYASVNHHADV